MPESTAVGTDHPARRIQKIFRSTMKLKIYGRYGMSWQALTETIRISAVLKAGNKKCLWDNPSRLTGTQRRFLFYSRLHLPEAPHGKIRPLPETGNPTSSETT